MIRLIVILLFALQPAVLMPVSASHAFSGHDEGCCETAQCCVLELCPCSADSHEHDWPALPPQIPAPERPSPAELLGQAPPVICGADTDQAWWNPSSPAIHPVPLGTLTQRLPVLCLWLT